MSSHRSFPILETPAKSAIRSSPSCVFNTLALSLSFFQNSLRSSDHLLTRHLCILLIQVETILNDPLWLLIFTMSVSDPLLLGLGFDLASLYEPFFTLTAGQDPLVTVPLSPFNGGI